MADAPYFDPDVIDNAAASRYELHVGDDVAVAEYSKRGDLMILTHTEVPTELEGRGVAGRLARRALDDARMQGMRVVPRCPFMRAYIEKHPEYQDLVWMPPDSDARAS